MLSHIFRTVLPAQFTICVTLFAVMNSKSYRVASKVRVKIESLLMKKNLPAQRIHHR